MNEKQLADSSHRRGQEEADTGAQLPAYDPSCYLCPGNQRAAGAINPQYQQTFIFVNDYSAMEERRIEDQPADDHDGFANELENRLLRVEAVTGKCYVVVFSKMHNQTLADLPVNELLSVVAVWTRLYANHVSANSLLKFAAAQYAGDDEYSIGATLTPYRYMQIFENKGPAMGCSNPHPHGQVWVTSSLPDELRLELEQLAIYRSRHENANLLEDYVEIEVKKGTRIVHENASFVVLCPWWAVWPFEVMIISRRRRAALVNLSGTEMKDLAQSISDIIRTYDNLFESHFPYSMGIHQAPLNASDREYEASHFHIHFYPPLLRSATVRKFSVGYDMMAEPQRDITPELAAERLRASSGELYRKRAVC